MSRVQIYKKRIFIILTAMIIVFFVVLFGVIFFQREKAVADDGINYPIRVLEIEPAGAYKYNSYNGAKKILTWLGISTKSVKKAEYTDYVEITVLPSNGVIGSLGDFVNEYDLIIIGDYNPKGYLASDALQGKGMYSPSGKYLMLNIAIEGTTDNLYASMSGNDITLKTLSKLENYIDEGKPLVLADSIYNAITKDTESNDSNMSVNMYQLSQFILEQNGYETGNIANENDSDINLTYISHPEVILGSKFRASYDNGIINSTMIDADTLSYFEVSGTIGSSSATYDIEIFIDKNGDGIFSEVTGENYELYYSSINSKDSKVTTNSDGDFIVYLNLPTELRGYVAIKVIAYDENGHSGQDIGSFIVGEGVIETVNVLQIVPLDDVSESNFLLSDSNFMDKFNAIADVVGINLLVDTVSVNEFNSWYDQVTYNLNSDDIYNPDINKLYNYDMLVLGFYDNFNRMDITSSNALNNIEDFINSGKAVLFTHDNFIYSAYSDINYENASIDEITTTKKKKTNLATSFYLTSRFRYIAGMDRYGVSDKSKISVASNNKATVFDDNYQGFTNLFMMRRGTDNGDAYKLYTGISDLVNSSVLTTTSVRQLNKGQITEYPYSIDTSITVSSTHSQWFLLDLESSNSKFLDSGDDVAVWYALYSEDSKSYYNLSGVDAINNYYIYSKGNITYSGCGHSLVAEDEEIELFVNTVVKAIKSGNTTPVINFSSGVALGLYTYEQAVRSSDINSSNVLDNASNYLKFTPSDVDMGISNGSYSYGLCYWDVDGDGVYDENVDVIIKEYQGSGTCYNNIEEVIDLRDYLSLTNSSGETLLSFLNKGILTINIYVEDTNRARGSAYIHLVKRDLFDLD